MSKQTNRCTERAQLKHSLESAVGVFPASTASVVVFSRRQLIRGSCTKASSMAITLSLLLRSTRTTFSQVNLHRDDNNCYVFESQSTEEVHMLWTIPQKQDSSQLQHAVVACNRFMPCLCLAAFCDTLCRSWSTKQRGTICPCHH